MRKVLYTDGHGIKERRSNSASEGESYDYHPNEECLKDESEPGVESHPDGGNQIFRGICSQTSLV